MGSPAKYLYALQGHEGIFSACYTCHKREDYYLTAKFRSGIEDIVESRREQSRCIFCGKGFRKPA